MFRKIYIVIIGVVALLLFAWPVSIARRVQGFFHFTLGNGLYSILCDLEDYIIDSVEDLIERSKQKEGKGNDT